MNFKNLENFCKVHHFYHKQNFNCLVFFKSDGPVCNHLNVNFKEKKLLTIPLFYLKIDFCIFNPKTFEVKENC